MQHDHVFYLLNKIGAELLVYLEEGTYHKRPVRVPSTNDMKTLLEFLYLGNVTEESHSEEKFV